MDINKIIDDLFSPFSFYSNDKNSKIRIIFDVLAKELSNVLLYLLDFERNIYLTLADDSTIQKYANILGLPKISDTDELLREIKGKLLVNNTWNTKEKLIKQLRDAGFNCQIKELYSEPKVIIGYENAPDEIYLSKIYAIMPAHLSYELLDSKVSAFELDARNLTCNEWDALDLCFYDLAVNKEI